MDGMTANTLKSKALNEDQRFVFSRCLRICI